MEIAELKKSIHQKIDNIDDLELLELVEAMVNRNNGPFVIPEHMKQSIKQGVEDLQKGDVFTIDDFEKKYEKWINE